jgi:glycosyltransferase involved in cell wall biosynthesis
MRQHVIHLARFGAMAGPRFSVAAPPEFLNDLPADIPIYEKIPIDIRPRLDIMADIRSAQALRKIAGNYSVVHAQGLRAGLITAMAMFRVPVPLVVTAHNMVPERLSERIVAYLIGRRASRMIAVSQAVADGLLRSGVSRSRVNVVPNGIDLPYFRGYGVYERPMLDGLRRGTGPARNGRGSARLQGRFKYQLPQNTTIIGYLGRLSPEKGVDVLLGAAASLQNCLFVIAGDGPQRAALEAAAPPNVRFLGRVDGAPGLLAAIDILAIPSRSEGQGIVALEAMASGVPIVASDVGGLKEMLRDGDTALLVRPGDARALCSAIVTCLDDPGMRDRMVARAGAEVEEQYDVRRMIVRIIGVYQQAMRHQTARV